jgi:Tfp pilus assembly protein PilN
MRAKEKRRPPPVPAAPQTEELEAARQAIDHLAVPWGGVFHALEAHTRTDIALLAVEPDAAGQTVKLTAAARDFPAVLDYLQDMQAAPVLTDVHLVNHRQEPQDPAWPWRFELQARWIVVSVNPK